MGAPGEATPCLFCRIVARQIPSQIVFEDRQLLAFKDVNPQAPVHLLVIPKAHVARVEDVTEQDQNLVGQMVLLARDLACQEGLQNGFRLVLNSGPQGGQTVYHLHLHLLGGRPMRWPPG